MKCMIVFVSCALAVASAGYSSYGPSSYAYQDNGAYHGGSHAVAYNAPIVNGGYAHAGSAYGYAHAAPVAHGYYGAEARLVDPVAVAAGAPLPVGDTYEVAAAKAAHFQAHAIARGQAGPLAHGYNQGGYYGAVAGAPLPVQDTYEVAAAKAAHFQAHAIARGQAHAGPVAHGYGYAHAAPVAHGYAHGYAHAAPVAHGYAHGGQYGSEARLVDPVAIAAGAPLPGGDTYEVAAAKAAHAHAHAVAKNGHNGW